jgi:ribonuclease D
LLRLAKHCELLLVFIYDPLERQLPQQGRYRFANDQHEVLVDSANNLRLQRYQQLFTVRQQQLTDLARHYRWRLLVCSTTDDPADCLRGL